MTTEPSRPVPPDKSLAQFHRVHIAGKDFQEANEFSAEFHNARSDIVRCALLVAAIVAYSRPFTQNEGKLETRATPAVPGKLLRELTPPEKVLHARILDLRNKAVAHSTFATRPVERVTTYEGGFGVESKPFDILNKKVDVAMLESMCHKLYVACHLIKHELSRQMVRAGNAA